MLDSHGRKCPHCGEKTRINVYRDEARRQTRVCLRMHERQFDFALSDVEMSTSYDPVGHIRHMTETALYGLAEEVEECPVKKRAAMLKKMKIKKAQLSATHLAKPWSAPYDYETYSFMKDGVFQQASLKYEQDAMLKSHQHAMDQAILGAMPEQSVWFDGNAANTAANPWASITTTGAGIAGGQTAAGSAVFFTGDELEGYSWLSPAYPGVKFKIPTAAPVPAPVPTKKPAPRVITTRKLILT